MLRLNKASFIKAGGKAGRVIAVVMALPLAFAAAVVEGEVGGNTRSIVFKAVSIGEAVGEAAIRDTPHMIMTLVTTTKAIACAAREGVSLIRAALANKQSS